MTVRPHVPLERDDFWRWPAVTNLSSYKEWHHFIVTTDDLCLLINFSFANGALRLIVMGTAYGWTGVVEHHRWADAELRNGTELRVGGHRLSIADDRYELEVRTPEITLELVFRPRAQPMVAREHPIGGGRRLSWLICPLMAVDGWVDTTTTRHAVASAVGYHDHNWGSFDWGDDFVWEWGIVYPEDPRGDWAAVFSSLMNKARTLTTLEQVLVWHRGDNRLALANGDLEVETMGRRSVAHAWTLPPVMRLVAPGAYGDVPHHLRVHGQRGRDRLELDLDFVDHARLVVPSEREPLGVVSIHECIARGTLSAVVGGEQFGGAARGIFEMVRHG